MRILASALGVLAIASTLGSLSLEAASEPIPDGVVAAYGGIVSVRVREVVKVAVFRNGRFLREPVEGVGAGSGVVVSADGFILTNAHVVAGSTEVTIGTSDGRAIGARVISVDEASDLALLRAAAGGLHPIGFQEDGLPKPGAALFVLGNRGDLGLEVGWARMGSHERVRVGARPLEFWAEVLAPVGPGDSGGAVVDTTGRLVGVPSLLVTSTAGTERSEARSAGLFIPARHARRALKKMMMDGPSAVWPWVGALLDDPLIEQSQGSAWDEAHGATVRRVFPGSPAAEADLRPGDRVVAVGSRPVRDDFEALDAVLDLTTGQKTTLTVERDGRRLDLSVVTAPRPADPRPDPIDDFALHTGLRLTRPAASEGHGNLALAGMSARTRRDLPEYEAVLFDERPALVSILPGQNALEGLTRRLSVSSSDDLASIMERCFVEEQFVALAHWDFGGHKTLDRAHVHRKIYPVVL